MRIDGWIQNGWEERQDSNKVEQLAPVVSIPYQVPDDKLPQDMVIKRLAKVGRKYECLQSLDDYRRLESNLSHEYCTGLSIKGVSERFAAVGSASTLRARLTRTIMRAGIMFCK
jgi:hypothetical protein